MNEEKIQVLLSNEEIEKGFKYSMAERFGISIMFFSALFATTSLVASLFIDVKLTVVEDQFTLFVVGMCIVAYFRSKAEELIFIGKKRWETLREIQENAEAPENK